MSRGADGSAVLLGETPSLTGLGSVRADGSVCMSISPARRWMSRVLAALLGLIFVLGGAALLSVSVVVGVLLMVLGVVFALGGEARVIPVRVCITETGLVVRNAARTHRLAWAQIDHYDCRGERHFVVCRDGRRVPMVALAGGPFGWTARANRQADIVIDQIERHQSPSAERGPAGGA